MMVKRVNAAVQTRVRAGAWVISAALMLGACSGIVPNPQGAGPATSAPRPAPRPAPTPSAGTPQPPVAPGTPATPGTPLPNASTVPAATAATTGVVRGPDIASLSLTPEGASRALAAFRLSCSGVQRRTDASGLTQGSDWAAACGAARDWPTSDGIRFFTQHFAAVQVGDGRGFATGYYEPEIAGSRTRRAGYDVPVYARPNDLVDLDLTPFSESLAGKMIRGRLDGNRFVPYFDRAQIDGGALSGRGLEIAWVADAVEFFFLQVQGSGRLRLPDGGVMRIGYAGQNGHDYVGIGRLLRDRGVLAPGEASMQGLMGYLRRQPDGGTAIMHENPSWVFFRELTGPGPLGAMGVPVTARASVAADPAFVPLGAPVLLAMDRAEASGLWIAQDTGGAIKGANRFDTFWGAGDDARAIAGGMSARGSVLLLLPRVAVDRLTAAR